ncbi:putative multidrug-efflux transporter [Vibrio cholerae]|nr:putative multidrug-efflux transporter [Vibrio cholerae]
MQAIAALPQSEILHAFQIGFAVAALLALLGALNALRAPKIQLDDYAFDS